MDDFAEALKMLEKKTHFKALLIISICLLIFQVVEARIIMHDTENWEDSEYHTAAAWLSGIFAVIGFITLIMYFILYYWYIALMKRESPDLDSMKCQVHTFFIFMTSIVIARITVHIWTTILIYSRQQNTDTTQVTLGTFFYINGIIECMLNLLILFYRVKTQKNSEAQ
jgi:hypothetical protein